MSGFQMCRVFKCPVFKKYLHVQSLQKTALVLLFQDGENASPTSDVVTVRTGSTSSNREKVVPVYKERNRENEIDAGKWSQAKLGKKSHAVPIDKIRLVYKGSTLVVKKVLRLSSRRRSSRDAGHGVIRHGVTRDGRHSSRGDVCHVYSFSGKW
jgi:hypothetical protein